MSYICIKLKIYFVMFKFIKRYRERRLRERCIKYALQLNNVYSPKVLFQVADDIMKYIKSL